MEKPDSGRSGIPLDVRIYIRAINFPSPSSLLRLNPPCVSYSTMSVVVTSGRCSFPFARLEMKLTKRRLLFPGRVVTSSFDIFL